MNAIYRQSPNSGRVIGAAVDSSIQASTRTSASPVRNWQDVILVNMLGTPEHQV